jgi:hypothetical protein
MYRYTGPGRPILDRIHIQGERFPHIRGERFPHPMLLQDPNDWKRHFTGPQRDFLRHPPGFKKGGLVKKTGVAFVHKGEFVLPVGVKPTKAQIKQVAKRKNRK